jgi:hypothetical protein
MRVLRLLSKTCRGIQGGTSVIAFDGGISRLTLRYLIASGIWMLKPVPEAEFGIKHLLTHKSWFVCLR